mmetsp:Transcript_5316/g.15051  ORF Transcript_5316/g.15051 Transcript_5316/m.15051 type:complete len:237 (-) Transcript_5316:87-797(-)
MTKGVTRRPHAGGALKRKAVTAIAPRRRAPATGPARPGGNGKPPAWAATMAVRKSRIRGAGLGLFAVRQLKQGYTLPSPYRGRRLTEKQLSRTRDFSYVFELRGACAAIDAKDTLEDNPLRYVNGACTAGQRKRINIFSRQRGANMYFVTSRRVAAGEELVIDYGPEYWKSQRFQHRRSELVRELRKLRGLRASLGGGPSGPGGKRRADLEARIASAAWDLGELEVDSDSDGGDSD